MSGTIGDQQLVDLSAYTGTIQDRLYAFYRDTYSLPMGTLDDVGASLGSTITTFPKQLYTYEYDQAYTWTKDWTWYADTDPTITDAFGVQSSQFRDAAVSYDGTKVVVTGGVGRTAWVDGPADNVYWNAGGAGGTTSTPLDTWALCFDTSDGTLLWSTQIGSDDSYERSYALEIIGNTVVVAGRAGSEFPVTSGVLEDTFLGDANPNAGVYGPQNPAIVTLNLNTGERIASSYNENVINGGGYNRDVDVDTSGNYYISVNRYAGGSASQIVGQRVMKINPSLSAIDAEVAIGPVSAKLGGEPSLRVNSDNTVVYAMIGTDVASPLGTQPGVFMETIPVSTAHSAYIAQLSTEDLSFITGTYLHHDATLNMQIETHGLTLLPDDKPAVVHQLGSGTLSSAPLTADYIYGSSSGSQSIVLTVLSADLTEVTFCTHLHTNGASESKALDSIAVGPGGRLAIGVQTNSTTFQTTDGSANTGNNRAGVWVAAPLETGAYWLEFAAMVDDVDDGETRGIGWAPNGDMFLCGISNNNTTGGGGGFVAKYVRSEVTPSFAKAAGVSARFRSPLTMAGMGISQYMTVEIKQLRLDLAATMTVIDTTSGLWKLVVTNTGALSIRGNGVGSAVTGSAGVITAGATHDYVFTVDGSGVAHVYLDGSSTPALSSSSGANATGTDQLFFLAGAACGVTTCGQITMWDEYAMAGVVPTATPLKILRGYGRTLNHDSWKIDAGLYT